MLKKVFAAVLVLTAIWSVPAHAAEEAIPAEKVKSVQIFAETCRWTGCYNTPVGSGFFLKGGYVITNHHVINPYTKFLVKDGTGKTYAVDVYGYDNDYDLAMLRLRDPVDHPYFDLADDEKSAKFGSYASSSDAAFVHKEGLLLYSERSLTVDFNNKVISDRVRAVYSMQSIQGNSGAGIFDDQGKISGVVLAREDGTGNAAAVRLADLKDFVERMFDGNDTNNRRLVFHENKQ